MFPLSVAPADSRHLEYLDSKLFPYIPQAQNNFLIIKKLKLLIIKNYLNYLFLLLLC